MVIAITEMQKHHLDDVVSIERVASATPWSADVFLKEMQSPTHLLLVGVEKNNGHESVIGFCGGQIIGDELHIHSLATDPKSRREGNGRLLIESLLGKAKSKGVRKATLEVRKSNVIAISLYESLGFELSSQRKNYYRDNGEDAQIMWLNSIKVSRA